MNKQFKATGLTIIIQGLALCTSLPVQAHHSFVSDFDPDKPNTIQGTVTEVQWENPHARFFVLVKDSADPSKLDKWEVELGSPYKLIHYGWTRKTVAPGMSVTVSGFLARDGHKYMNSTSVKLPDGHTIDAGSSYQTGKTPGL